MMRKVLLTIVAALAFAGPAAADTTYTDPSGENPAAADISTVVVKNDPGAHTITFSVQITNMPALEDNSLIGIAFDSDRNVSTGDSDGFDYDFFVGKDGWGFEKWDGTQWVDVPEVTTLPVSYTNGLMTVTLRETDIAVTQGFDFAVLTLRGPDPNAPATDLAPNADPIYAYVLTAASTTPTATIKSTSVAVSGTPKAGKKFTVGPYSVNLSDGTSIDLAGLKCQATLGVAKLKGTGGGGCTFALPKTAKGKKLVIKVSAKAAGVTLSKTLTLRVK